MEGNYSIPRSKRLPRASSANHEPTNGRRVTRLNVAFLGYGRRRKRLSGREGRSLSPSLSPLETRRWLEQIDPRGIPNFHANQPIYLAGLFGTIRLMRTLLSPSPSLVKPVFPDFNFAAPSSRRRISSRTRSIRGDCLRNPGRGFGRPIVHGRIRRRIVSAARTPTRGVHSRGGGSRARSEETSSSSSSSSAGRLEQWTARGDILKSRVAD